MDRTQREQWRTRRQERREERLEEMARRLAAGGAPVAGGYGFKIVALAVLVGVLVVIYLLVSLVINGLS